MYGKPDTMIVAQKIFKTYVRRTGSLTRTCNYSASVNWLMMKRALHANQLLQPREDEDEDLEDQLLLDDWDDWMADK